MKKLVKWNKWIDYFGSVCFALLLSSLVALLLKFIIYIDGDLLRLYFDLIGLLFKIYIACKLCILFWWMDLNINKEKDNGSI